MVDSATKSPTQLTRRYISQRALLADVVERRCAGHPLFGRPADDAGMDFSKLQAG